jgi:hypothetical protein
MRPNREQQTNATRRRVAVAGAVSALAALTAVGGGTAWAARGHQASHRHHPHGNHYVITSTSQVSPGVLGELEGHGVNGANGHAGATGATGATGTTGPQGPGAVEYTYNSTAPAASDQNTPLGPAGPFSDLTGSCTVNAGIVSVALGATNQLDVAYDETRIMIENGSPAPTQLVSQTQAASATPATLIALPNDNALGDSYTQASLTVTSPVDGVLDVFGHVSYADNTCHLSVVWTPAG